MRILGQCALACVFVLERPLPTQRRNVVTGHVSWSSRFASNQRSKIRFLTAYLCFPLMFSCLQIFVFAFLNFFLIYYVSLQECWVDAGSIDVHCVVVVYEFLCGWWCVLNRSGSQQTALITSDTPVSHLRLPRAPAFPACCLPCTSTCKIRKHCSHFEKKKRLHGKVPPCIIFCLLQLLGSVL